LALFSGLSTPRLAWNYCDDTHMDSGTAQRGREWSVTISQASNPNCCRNICVISCWRNKFSAMHVPTRVNNACLIPGLKRLLSVRLGLAALLLQVRRNYSKAKPTFCVYTSNGRQQRYVRRVDTSCRAGFYCSRDTLQISITQRPDSVLRFIHFLAEPSRTSNSCASCGTEVRRCSSNFANPATN
jgi:hypothetical protein